MSVTRCERARNGWTGSGQLKGGNQFTVDYLVWSNSLDDGPMTIVLGALYSSPHPLPAVFATYQVGNDIDLGVRMLSRSSAVEEYIADGTNKVIWRVTNNYKAPGNQEEEDQNNPLTRPVKYHVEWAAYTKVIEKDETGDAVRNSAGERFADPLEQDDHRPVLVASYNVASLAQVASLGITYRNAVNTSPFWGAGVREAKVQSITAGEQQEEDGIKFYPLTIRVEFNDRKWDREILDQGMKYKSGGELKAMDDSKGVKTGEPGLLAATGDKLAVGATPHFVTFRTYPERDFSGLGI